MSAAVSIYIYDQTPSGQSRLYKHRKFSVHGTVSYVVFQNIPGYDVLLPYTMGRFLPPTYACQRVKNLLYGTISYVVFIVITTVLFRRLVSPLPTFVRTRNSLYVRCMENHIKTSMLRLEKMVCCIY